MAASLFGSRRSVDLSHKLHKNTANSQQIGNFHQKILTRMPDYGLMRPVARIAQSVEQGIENPRVLGSIPSSGTTIQSRLVRFARCNPDGHEDEPVKTRRSAVTCC